ncbi:4Fe-4S binding protein [Escherichia coli]
MQISSSCNVQINLKKCDNCGLCLSICPVDAIEMSEMMA